MLTKKRETSIVDADALLPTKFGEFRIRAFHDPNNNKEHALLYLVDRTKTPVVRVHSECLTGDAFGSLRCDCGPQLEASMKEIQEHGCGAIVYLKQEGRGIGLYAKMQAYALQDKGTRHPRRKPTTWSSRRCKNLRHCGENAQINRVR